MHPIMETLLCEDTVISLTTLHSGPIREVTSLMQGLLTGGTVNRKLLCVCVCVCVCVCMYVCPCINWFKNGFDNYERDALRRGILMNYAS